MKSLYLSCLIFLTCLFSISAQTPLTVPFTESFSTGLNGWKVRIPSGIYDWRWYNDVGVDSLILDSPGVYNKGGLRMKLPAGDSNYVASPGITFQAGKTYTLLFKSKVAQGTSYRIATVGTNTVRAFGGQSIFFTQKIFVSPYVKPPFTEYISNFTVPNTGTYYLIFSFKEFSYLFTYLDEIKVEETNFPIVSISSPVTGGSMNENYTDSTKISISANASDTDGTITKVEFFGNGEKIGEKLTAPYTILLKDVIPKDYVFTVKATDNRGNTTTSLPVNYRVNFRDGTFPKYVNWDFNANNTIGKNTDYWAFSGGQWLPRNVGFHGSNCLDNFTVPTNAKNNYAASPGVYLQAGQTYNLEFLAQASNKTIKLFLNKKPVLSDSIRIIPNDTVLIRINEDYKVIHKKTFTVAQSGTYHLIIYHLNTVSNTYTKIHLDNIRISGNGLNIAPVSTITKPVDGTVIPENVTLAMSASSIDPDGDAIQKIEYYVNNTKVAESSTPPNFQAFWQNIPRGTYDIEARPIDTGNAQGTSLTTTVVADTNRFPIASLIGGTGDDEIRGIVFQKNGTLVLAANMSNLSHLNIPTKFLKGATNDSSGVIMRLSTDGKTILSMTRLCTRIADISKDGNDNLYIAAWKSGIIKLNPTADTLRWQKTFPNPVHRVDAGSSGRNVCMTSTDNDINDVELAATQNYLHDANGNFLQQYGPVTQYGSDVTIDEISQTVITVGFKNIYLYDRIGGTVLIPAYVAVMRGYAYNGTQKYKGYDWDADTTSVRWLNRSENNMADSRFNRCMIGRDGKLYIAGQLYGGNHLFRYSPFDIRIPVPLVNGDEYFHLINVGTEIHTYIGKFDPATGNVLQQQTLTGRLESGYGSSIAIDGGGMDVDSVGRVYLTGTAASGMPMTTDYIPGEYTGGAYAIVLSPDFTSREVSVRLSFGYGRAIAAYNKNRWAYCGYSNQGKEYLSNSFQATNLSTTTKKWEGWLAYANTLKCPNTRSISAIPIGTLGMSGQWNVPSTWQCGQIPTASNQVTIDSGHTVTIPSGYTGKAQSLELKGILKKEVGSGFEIRK